MIPGFAIPPTGFGPGSQPVAEDGAELAYLAMPSGMRAYAPHLPEVADPAALAPALSALAQMAEACDAAAADGRARRIDLRGLDAANLALIAETLGQGEVSATAAGRPALRAQEAVFAGVWRLMGDGVDAVEIAAFPSALLARAFAAREAASPAAAPAAGVVNAPAIVAELLEAAAAARPGAEPHVVNLSLLPHTPEDLEHFDRALGRGSVEALSRGYGACRVSATAVPGLWRVRHHNSTDALILDSFEATDAPAVILAAPEDLADSAERLREVLEAIR